MQKTSNLNDTVVTRMIDFPTWFARSFSSNDLVVAKLDVEGAEHDILARMMAEGTVRWIDTMFLECHNPSLLAASQPDPCSWLLARIQKAAPRMQIIREGTSWYHGLDSYSRAPPADEAKQLVRICNQMRSEDHGNLMLSWKRAPPTERSLNTIGGR